MQQYNNKQEEDMASYDFSVKKLTPNIGALITGIDLTKGASQEICAQLKEVLLDAKVLFFRDQNISLEQHMSFARHFGDLEVHPFAPTHKDHPEVLVLSHGKDSKGTENFWHSDVTWRKEPSLGSILRAKRVPETGGDTLFADMYVAYENLSDEVKEKVEGRIAIHDFGRVFGRNLTEEKRQEMKRKYPLSEHPVIRTHPETGRKAIYVNTAFTDSIKDMDKAESAALLAHLYAQANTPEYQCRFKWQPNSIAFWDNRSCQHYAASDYWPNVRVMERVTIVGDKPYYSS
ncbi:Taurine dioxygenase [marine gamma proteobacterium HTCC2143]|uniref:Taurine dioxygenase n=1 Tax=marine gamma proteobacterium HTCC2143 TaxID=247633 RepID=A0YFC7_9GAMM|nr:Taurine dioxygenase [marine gamma proteobacterium HTCC2143]